MLFYISGQMWGEDPEETEKFRIEADYIARRIADDGHSVIVPHTMYAYWENRPRVSELRIGWVYNAEAVLVLDDTPENTEEISLARSLKVPIVDGSQEVSKARAVGGMVDGFEGMPNNELEVSQLKCSGKITKRYDQISHLRNIIIEDLRENDAPS